MNFTKIALLVAGMMITIPILGSDIYRMDLSPYSHDHALTRQEPADLFQSPSIINSPTAGQSFDAGLIRVVNDPFGGAGKVLSIQFRGGVGGIGTADNPSGGQWKIEFGGKAYEDLYMAMELGVDNNWITPKGMHLPFLTATPFAANRKVDPDTWASFFQLYGNNSYVKKISKPVHKHTIDDAFALYYYNFAKAQSRAWFNTINPTEYSNRYLPHNGQVQLARNGYISLEQRLKLNSVPTYDAPEKDGLMQAWANGKPAVDKRNFAWRRDASQTIEHAWMLWWTGGPRHSPEWAQPKDQIIYLNSFVISDKPITH